MLKIQRLNMDTSWKVVWGDTCLVIDPWLIGSEVDSFSWLNEQWHVVDPVRPEAVGEFDHIVISQSYSDHCHEETLRLLPAQKKIFASELAYKRLLKNFPEERLHLLEREQWNRVGELEIMSMHPGRRMDPVYFAHLIRNGNDAVFYSSHGFTFNEQQLKAIKGLNFKLLMTTFTDFLLPGIMGGNVNPGMKNVYELIELLNPENVMNSHDEPKKMKGLVGRLSKVKYQDLGNADYAFNFIHTPDYREVVV